MTRQTSYNPLMVECARRIASEPGEPTEEIEQHITNYINVSHINPFSEEWKREELFLSNYMLNYLKRKKIISVDVPNYE